MQKPKNQLKKLEFELNDNNKLLCLNFICVVPPTSYYETGERFQIRIADKHFCFVEVLIKKEMLFEEMITAGYNYLDAGLAENQYYEYLCKRFKGKRWWNEKDTIFNVVFFKKIVQLNMFDDNNELTDSKE
mgnify:FL=1